MLDFSAMSGRLPEGMGEAAWKAIRPNLETVAQAADWWSIVTGPLEPPALEAEDRAFLAQAPDVLTGLAWDDQVWKALTSALKEQTGRKGKALFLPLRLALTGREHGPDMAALLPLIGRDAALERLAAAG
jgi:glutamyl-tRNA synthetase